MRYPIFVINLARHPQRFRFMEAQLGALGLVPTRIEAFNGKDPALRRQAAAASYSPLNGAEIGCFESHRRIWKRVIDENLPGAFVLEDDCVVASDFATLDFAEEVLADCDLIKIDDTDRASSWYGTRTFPAGGNRHLCRLLGSEYSTAGYFVTARGARRLYRLSRRYFLHVDHFMFDQRSPAFWKLNVWKLCPVAVTQARFLETGIGEHRELHDSIEQERVATQQNRGRTAWEALSPLQMFRLRLRRLLGRDTVALRRRRTRAHMAAFARTEPVIETKIPFESPGLDHVARAEAEAFGE